MLALAYLARQNGQNSLVKIHDRMIASKAFVRYLIRVNTNNQIVAQSGRFLQEVHVTNVCGQEEEEGAISPVKSTNTELTKHIERSVDVNDLVPRIRVLPLGKLNDLLCGGQKL